MTSWFFMTTCVLLCTVEFSLADKDDGKCTKMADRAELEATSLRKHLLCTYDKYTAPVNTTGDNRVAVKTMLIRYRVKYKTSEEWTTINNLNMLENSPNWFTVSTYVFMTWEDPRLKWNASERNNRTRVFFDKDEIWFPYAALSMLDMVLFAESKGTVTLFFWTDLIGNCWPIHFIWGDQRKCVLSFKVEPYDKVQLIKSKNDYDFQTSNTGTWSIVKAKRVFPLNKGEKNADFERIHQERPYKYGPGYFETSLIIQRNFAVQDAAIFAPAAVLVILLISTTWIPATNVSRVAMLSLIVVVQVFMFHQACGSMPFLPTKLVEIVRLYQDLIICTGAAVLEWLAAYNLSTQEGPLAKTLGATALPRPSIFTFFKTIFVVSEKGSSNIEMAILLDRITFLVLSLISFILVVLTSRPPVTILDKEDVHTV